jgi:predicted DNA-binding protein (UPF0251 family)
VSFSPLPGGGYLQSIHVDIDQLAKYVKWKMDESDLSLRDAAREAGVSAPTLSRILKKGRKRSRPDVDTLGKVIRWVGVPIDKIIETTTDQEEMAEPGVDTVETIEVHLRADRNLSAEAAQAIAQMVKVAYAQFAQSSKGRR